MPRFAWKLAAIFVFALGGSLGFPLLIVLVWQLSPDDDLGALGIAVIALGAALLVYSAIALLKFVARP